MISAFFSDTDLTGAQVKRVSFVVGHHHTYDGVDGLDWQILLEADYIVNASENAYSKENLQEFLETHAKLQREKD